MTRSLFSPLTASYLGFDSFFDEIDRVLGLASTQAVQTGFPPLNVYKDGEDYTIELAVAGFREENLKIEHDEKRGTLTVTGNTGTDATAETRQVVKQGIATRKFMRSFTVAENLKVDAAGLENGMLTIRLKADEEKKYVPRQIPLSAPAPQLAAPQQSDSFLKKLTGKKAEKAELQPETVA